MITFLSEKLKFLLVIILVVIAVSFVFFDRYFIGDGSRGPGAGAKIAGQPVHLVEIQQAIRAERLGYTLATGQIPPSSSEADQQFASLAWNRMLVLRDAQAAGFQLPAGELEKSIRTMPLFQKPGTSEYSPETFARFKQFILDPQGISTDRFLEVMRDQRVAEAWLQAVDSTAVVLPSETDDLANRLFGRANIAYVELTAASVASSITVTDESLRAFYNARTERFHLPEQRKVDVVVFRTAAGGDEAAAARARREAGEKAYQFTEPFYLAAEEGRPLPDFAAAAATAGVTVATSPYFTRDGAVPGSAAGPSLAQQAFLLTKEKPVSDSIAIPEGFAVLHLREIQPPTPRPFESVKAEVRKAYLDSETTARLQVAGENLVLKLRQAVAGGSTWAQAAAAAGVRPVSLPPFVPAEQEAAKDPAARIAGFIALQQEPGSVSDLIPSGDRVYVFHFASRTAPDAAKRAEILPRVKKELAQRRRLQVREEWLSALARRPGTVTPADLLRSGLN